MKTASLLVVSILLLVGCIKRETSETAPKAPRSSAPNFPEVQFYIHTAEHEGAHSTPIWDYDNGPIEVSFSTHLQGEPEYALKAEFQGSSESKDFYEVIVTLQPESGDETFTEKVAYEGREIEFWRGKRYTIGMRPFRNKNSEQDPAEP